ncbi:MAG: Protein of unknown function (DUF1553)/Protein of unknown function (DUF1549)/Planctomycete, partial [Planctomycetaceae bacterium]|nr:Protein of unknown function (DUF1553)/Protein of unknown function (DUF1549)/Planctomycete [Planctomycetaceae bacterium]
MSRCLKYLCGMLLACQLVFAATEVSAAEPEAKVPATDPAAFQFFEQKIRPLLVAKCQECHGSEKQKSNFRVDSREAFLEGGDSGAALVPLEPMKSMLMDV